ncbi:hypothetical protein [Brachybacterium sp. UNK5269]|uniref:hypothetical protein n=1 Tax=Brachybacterium sp. UNK5269 TaxID=3408576 RepID=UPI003BAF1779
MNCRPPPRSLPEGFCEVRSMVSGLQQRTSSTSVGVGESGPVVSGSTGVPACVLDGAGAAPPGLPVRSTR